MSGVSDAWEWFDDNLLSAGGKEVKANQEEIYDTSEKIIQAQLNAMQRTGAYSEAELQQQGDAWLSENDKNREQALKDADKLIASNRAWNVVGLVGSAASFVGSAPGVIGKLDDVANAAKVTSGLDDVARAAGSFDDIAKLTGSLDDAMKVANISDDAMKTLGAVKTAAGTFDDVTKLTSKLDDAARALDAVDNATDAQRAAANAIKSVQATMKDGKVTSSTLKALSEIDDHAEIANIIKDVDGMGDIIANAKTVNSIANVSDVAKIAGNVKTATTAQGILARVGQVPGKVINGTSNFIGGVADAAAGGSKLAGSTARGLSHMGLCMAPTFITQIYTHSRTDKINNELVSTLGVLNDRLAYLDANMEKFPQEFQESASTFGQEYSDSMTDLYEQYEAGTITQEQYDQGMSEIADTYNDKYDQLKRDYPEYIQDDCAINSFQYCADRGLDYNTMANNSYILQDDIERNPSIAKAAEIMQQNKYGTAKTEIGCFFKTINATIIKYCPFVATIEAAALKLSDSTFDFIRDTITQHDGVSKYQNQTIADIADSIRQDSEEHLAAKVAARDALDSVLDSQQTLAEREGITQAPAQPETQQQQPGQDQQLSMA